MNGHTFEILIAALIVAGSQLGCGGSSGGSQGSCGKVYPCGGNIVGRWKITDTCFPSSGSASVSCPESTLDSTSLKFAGTLTYTADMKYSAMASLTGSLQVAYPLSCLMNGSLNLTCAEFEALQRQGMAQDPKTTFQSITCATKGATCACTLVTSADSNVAGTYVVDGTKLTETETGKPPSDNNYCVQGNQLHIVELNMAVPMPTMSTNKIIVDVVLDKQ